MNKELFRKTEGILYEYNDLTNKIELLRAEIKEMEEEYRGCSAIQYEEKTGNTNKFNSSVENEVISREQKLVYYYKDLNRKQTLKRRIDVAIESLKEEEKQFETLHSHRSCSAAHRDDRPDCRQMLRRQEKTGRGQHERRILIAVTRSGGH